MLIVSGRVRGRTIAAVDEWVTRLLQDTYVHVAFVGADGVSVGRGLTTPDTALDETTAGQLGAAGPRVVRA